MIHQLIFAHPKPGMSEKEFQNYWVNFHAIYYASNIPQFKRYLVNTRIPLREESKSYDPLFSGVAEIWLENEEEQLTSLQSREFLAGARLDEPNWAAFWSTIVLDTTTHVLSKKTPMQENSSMVKLFILVKRKAGMSLEEFRHKMLQNHAFNVMELPGLRRYLQCHVRDNFYAIGESLLDCVSQLWFDDLESLERAFNSSEYLNLLLPEYEELFESKYIHQMVTTENWIIGPEFR